MGNEHVTKANPIGALGQCDRRAVHEPHEYQAEFGAYFDTHCPGIAAGDRSRIAELEQALAEQGLANFALKAQMEAAQEENKRLRGILDEIACDCDDWPDWHASHAIASFRCRAEAAEAKVARIKEILEVDGGWYSGLAWCKAVRAALKD